MNVQFITFNIQRRRMLLLSTLKSQTEKLKQITSSRNQTNNYIDEQRQKGNQTAALSALINSKNNTLFHFLRVTCHHLKNKTKSISLQMKSVTSKQYSSRILLGTALSGVLSTRSTHPSSLKEAVVAQPSGNEVKGLIKSLLLLQTSWDI